MFSECTIQCISLLYAYTVHVKMVEYILKQGLCKV